MLSVAEIHKTDKVLDLGCGYGVVGIVAAKFANPDNVYLSDIDEDALSCARKNAAINHVEGIHIIKSHAYENLDETGFDKILSNPPYHSNFFVPKTFIEKGFNRLKVGGRLFMVTKRKDWYKNKFISIFGGVTIHQEEDYFIFEAEKKGMQYKSKKE
jgi:16S rRNA (guanine1207-N2)-methyltransferase